MALSLPAFSRCLLWGLAAMGTCTVQSQSVDPQGPESRLHGALPGDQVFPAVALGANGGLVVWQDNAIDSKDVGVAACRIDANFSPVSDVFRVNSTIRGDQTQPAVALLPDGGAVFTFKGHDPSRRARFGNPDLYVRFMLPDGRFAGRDYSLTPRTLITRARLPVSRPSWRNNQLLDRTWRIPVRVTLERQQTADAHPMVVPNGDVAVVYSGLRRYETNTYEILTRITSRTVHGVLRFTTNDVLQRLVARGNTRQDIFLGLFGSNRKLRRPEVMVNQFVDNNQQHPAAAVLSDGRIVIVWVSEVYVAQSPLETSSVVIRARLFGSDGQPVGDEFEVNSEARVCARPSVAAGQGGTFTVAWNQRDLVRSNSWDVYARSFDAQGLPMTSAFRVNEQVYGDQFSPSVSGLELNRLVVWTSLGQDGSREGVYGRVLTPEGPAGREFRVNTTTASQQIHPVAAAQGPDRFVAFWSSFAGADGFEIMRQAYLSRPPLPAPAPPLVTALDESRLEISWPPVGAINVRYYELFTDSVDTPSIVQGTVYTAEGLAPGSTHTFQLAYVLTDGRRSLKSEAASGATLGGLGELAVGEALPGSVVPAKAGQAALADGGAGVAVLRVRMRFVGGSVELYWASAPGTSYQVQISNDFKNWLDYGPPRLAGGERESVQFNPKEGMAWFRVVELP